MGVSSPQEAGKTLNSSYGGILPPFGLMVLAFPLSRAEHRRGGRIKARGLSEPAVAKAKVGEFPRAPAAPATRRETP